MLLIVPLRVRPPDEKPAWTASRHTWPGRGLGVALRDLVFAAIDPGTPLRSDLGVPQCYGDVIAADPEAKPWSDAGWLAGQRRRRWPAIKLAPDDPGIPRGFIHKAIRPQQWRVLEGGTTGKQSRPLLNHAEQEAPSQAYERFHNITVASSVLSPNHIAISDEAAPQSQYVNCHTANSQVPMSRRSTNMYGRWPRMSTPYYFRVTPPPPPPPCGTKVEKWFFDD